MLAIWKIPPATSTNGKQNIQFQKNLTGNNAWFLSARLGQMYLWGEKNYQVIS